MKIDAQMMEKLYSDYKISNNFKSVAEKNNVSVYMVKKAVARFSMLNKEARDDVISYIDTKRKDACDFINKCLSIMADDDKLSKASVNQIASAMGIVIEKFTKNLSKDDTSYIDEILKAVQKIEWWDFFAKAEGAYINF